MKNIFGVLISVLLFNISFSQEKNIVPSDSITKDQVQLNEIIVVGNATADPTHTTVFNNNEEKIVQPKNVADLFNEINGFAAIKRGNYAIDPSFRASQYEQLNIQYDGGTRAMHACPNRMDPITTHIIPEEISKIEIVKGPYTVRYGPTFGGLINMVTQKPTYEDNRLHGKVSGGYESNGNSYVTMLHLQKVKEDYDLTGNIGYRDFGNYKDGNGIEIPSSFKSTDYGIKFGYNLSNSQRFQTHWRQSFGRDVLHAGLPMDTDYDNSSILSLDYKITDLKGLFKSVLSKAYYSYVDHLMTNFNRPTFMMTEAESSVNATTIGGKIEVTWQPDEKLEVFSGVDVMNVARNGVRIRKVKIMNGNPLVMPMTFNDKVWQDSYITDVGLFTEAKWYLNNATILTTGLRYDNVTSDIKDPEADFAMMYDLEKRTEHNLSGTISVKKLVSDNFTLEAAYGRGVRSANMIERYINHFTVGQDSYEYIGNPGLSAEVNNQFEIGFKGYENLYNGLNKFSYTSSFYYSTIENYIVAIVDESLNRKYMPMLEPRNPKVFRNLNNAYKTGFETMGKLDFLNDFYLKTELAYVYTKNKDFNESLPLNPPFTGKVSLGIERVKYWFNIKYNITSRQDHISESFGETETEGFDTLDFRLGIKPFTNVTLGVAILNVFDETYNNHLNFSFNNQADFGRVPINEPGRNMTAFLQYKF